MARGLLVSFAGYPAMASSLFPDNGLASLAAVLLQAGHEIKILDFNTVSIVGRTISKARSAELAAALEAISSQERSDETISQLVAIGSLIESDLERTTMDLAEEIAEEVDSQRSDFVGFRLCSGDGFIASIKIAESLRRRYPSLKIYGGGPAVLYSEAAIFHHTDVFDALVDGEGEEAIVGLAAYSEGRGDLTSVPNLILWDGEKVHTTRRSFVADLDTLPPPVYDPSIYPALGSDEKIRIFVLDESRGCPNKCAFCVHRHASGERWRVRSAERVIETMQSISSLFGTSSFRFGGSYTPGKFLRKFIDQLPQWDAPVRFCGFAHLDGLPKTGLEDLASVGCKSLFLGVESFFADDGDRLGKRLRPERAKEVILGCLEVGIVPVVSIIMPIPGGTQEGAEINRKALIELCAGTKSAVVTQFPALIPRSMWWESRERYGFELDVSEGEYQRFLATYKIRHIIPPSFWEPTPYRVDGLDFAGYAGINTQFQQELTRAGVVVNVPDEIVLLSDVLGEPLGELRKRLLSLFFCLDVDKIAAFTREVNSRLRAS